MPAPTPEIDETGTVPVLALSRPEGTPGIPMDVMVTVMGLLSAAYPQAMMGSQSDGSTVLALPAGARAKKVPARVVRDTISPPDPHDPLMIEWRQGPVLTVPEALAGTLLPLAEAFLGESENYTECAFHLRAGQTRLALVVARTDGQTPHELRAAADAETERLRDLIAAWRSHPGLTLHEDGTATLEPAAAEANT